MAFRLSKLIQAAFLSLLILMLGVSSGFGQGKGQGVEVLGVEPALREVMPGQILSHSFRVTNRSERTEEFVESLELPTGWDTILPQATFSLLPGESTTRLVAFRVPTQAIAARYGIVYSVRSQRDYAIQDFEQLEVVVAAVANLVLLPESVPEWVIAGDEYQVSVRLINQGNAALDVRLEVASEVEYPSTIAPQSLALGVGQSEVATVVVQTDPEAKKLRPQVVEVKATASSAGEEPIVVGIPISVQIIPRVTTEPDLAQRLPVTVALRTTGEDGDGGSQIEMAGAGPLDEDGNRSIDFLLRGPDVQDRSILGLRDEYRVTYQSPNLDVRVGDQTYGLSPLTEYYRYGRGIELTSRFLKYRGEWRAYLLRGRWESSLKEAAACVGSRINDLVTARLNLLSKRDSEDETGVSDRLWSLVAEVSPSDDTALTLEYAGGDSDRDGVEGDHAYRIDCQGKVGPRGYFNLSRTHAGPDYFGYYNDADYSSGTFSYRVTNRLSGHVSYRTYEKNLDVDADRDIAPRERIVQTGFQYDLRGGYYLSLDRERFRRRDELLPGETDYEEKPLTLMLGRSGRQYGWRFDVRTGKQEDFAAGESRHVTHYNLFAHYQPSPRETFTVYGGIGDRDTLSGSYLLGNRDNVGATVSLRPRDDLRLQLNYLRYGFRSDQTSDHREIVANYGSPGERMWSLRLRRTARDNADSETAYVLEYSIPFSVKIGKKRSLGSVSGRVIDVMQPERPGIANVVLHIGEATAVTEEDGRFIFPALRPGVYELRVASGLIGMNRVTEKKSPYRVKIEGGEVTRMDIGITEGATVEGQIGTSAQPSAKPAYLAGRGEDAEAYERDAKPLYEAVGPTGDLTPRSISPQTFQGILVELASGDEVVRTLTDYRGRFKFEGVRPGPWRLKAYEHNVPLHHHIEMPERELMVVSGGTYEETFEVLPTPRRVHIIDEGTLDALN